MIQLSLRNRIAFNYIVSTALLIGIVFCGIYFVADIKVSDHLNADLEKEVQRHSEQIVVSDGVIALKHHKEWMEREHNTIGVDPVFIEFTDANGNLIDKSPNLKNTRLLYDDKQKDYIFYENKLAEKRIKQVQVPILDDGGKKVGYLIVAVAREGSEVVLETLRQILLTSYPFILILLFFVARFIAGRSIKPINQIIDTANQITRSNLTSRIPLLHNRDELYTLSETINQLLDRIESAIEREKSFTSYASHEFRTPLAVLKGTLEILIRKPRDHEEYKEKIQYCIKEIDNLNHLVDDLLILTRYENQRMSLHFENISITEVINNTLNSFSTNIKSKEVEVKTNYLEGNIYLNTDLNLFSTIINNLISNATKYSHQKGSIEISLIEEDNTIFLTIKDNGIGIPSKDLDHIFDKFHRSEDNPDIKGFGLGLSIVKRFCQLLHIEIKIDSKESVGTTVMLISPQS